jgi:hypothetical protein
MKWGWLLFFVFLCSPMAWSRDMGFALSGGVSLGSYEAGVFYNLISENREDIANDSKVIFGTSAGGINGLFGIMDICGLKKNTRESSLLWRMWIPIGLDQLEVTDEKEKSLFQRKAITPLFGEIKERWKEGLNEKCDLLFGVAVARKEPFINVIRPGLEIVRQSEFFILRIRGQGPGRPPIVENQTYSNLNSFRSYLPVGESPDKDINILLDLIQASSAFPGAFTAYPLKFCYSKPGEKFKSCTSKNSKSEDFIDGGLYHNGPVGYAFEALKMKSKDKNFTLHYVNTESPLLTQKYIPKKKKEKNDDVFKEFYQLFLNFINQARKFELAKSLEVNPEIVNHLRTNPKNFPLVSEPLYAFLGFMETDFRKSDFYLGMHDAEKNGIRKSLDEDSEYECFREKLINQNSICPLDENLKILTDLAIYRNKKHLGEPDFDTVYDFLQKKKFEFKDLGMKKNESMYGKVYTKKRLTKLLKGYSDRQSKKEHKKLTYFIRPSLNFLKYTPPDRYWYAVYASTPEVGFSTLIPQRYFGTSPFRFQLATALNGFSNFFSRNEDIWAITPLAGIEYEPLWLNSAIWQWHGGLRLGYMFSPRDNFGQGDCDEAAAKENAAYCSGGTLQLFFAVSVLERIRVQLVYVPLVVNSITFDDRPELLLQVGIQFGDSY